MSATVSLRYQPELLYSPQGFVGGLATPSAPPCPNTVSLPVPSPLKRGDDPFKLALFNGFLEHTKEELLAEKLDLLQKVANDAFSWYNQATNEDASNKFKNLKHADIVKEYGERLSHKAHLFYVSENQYRMYLKLPHQGKRIRGGFKYCTDALCITFTKGQLPTFKKVARLTTRRVSNSATRQNDPNSYKRRIHSLLKEAKRLWQYIGKKSICQIEDYAKYKGKYTYKDKDGHKILDKDDHPRVKEVEKVITYQHRYDSDLERVDLSALLKSVDRSIVTDPSILTTSSGSHTSDNHTTFTLSDHSAAPSSICLTPTNSHISAPVRNEHVHRTYAAPAIEGVGASTTLKWELLRLFLDILDGVNVLHADNLIHADIKPTNIFVEGSHLVVGDLGLTRPSKGPLGSGSSYGGTVDYYAPERFKKNGSIGLPIDVFATGALFYWLLHKKTHAPRIELIRQKMTLETLCEGKVVTTNKSTQKVASSEPNDNKDLKDPQMVKEFINTLLKKIDHATSDMIALKDEPKVHACITGQTRYTQELKRVDESLKAIQTIITDCIQLGSEKITDTLKEGLKYLISAILSLLRQDVFNLDDIIMPDDELQSLIAKLLHPDQTLRLTIPAAREAVLKMLEEEKKSLPLVKSTSSPLLKGSLSPVVSKCGVLGFAPPLLKI